MFNVGKFDACIGAVDISCRKGNRNRADSSSGLVDEFCVVETANSVFGLGGNVFRFAKLHDVAVKFHIIKSSVIAEGNNGAFTLFADEFFTGNAGKISCAGCFNDNSNVGFNGESGVSGAVSANFLPGGEANGDVIFRFLFKKFHQNGAARAGIKGFSHNAIFT